MKRKILLLLILGIIVFGVSTHLYNKDLLHKGKPNFSPLVVAHRGASGYAPENTLLAVQKAIELQVDFIEIDVHLSQDGEVVVIHDATLERTTTGIGEVKSKTLAELKELDAGSWMGPTYKGEKIPTLEEVLELIDGKTGILIEIKKGKEGRYIGLEKKVIDLIRKYQTESWTVIQSFQKETVEEVIQLAPDLEVHKLLIGQLPFVSWHHDGEWQSQNPMKIREALGINPAFHFLTKRFVRKAREKGKKIFTYTINEVEDMETCMNLGVDAIITNYPDRLIELKKKNSSSD